jgi:hypothetical protein
MPNETLETLDVTGRVFWNGPVQGKNLVHSTEGGCMKLFWFILFLVTLGFAPMGKVKHRTRLVSSSTPNYGSILDRAAPAVNLYIFRRN